MSYIHFEGRILNLIISVRMVTVYQCDSIAIIFNTIDLANKEFRIIYISGNFLHIYIGNEYNIKTIKKRNGVIT